MSFYIADVLDRVDRFLDDTSNEKFTYERKAAAYRMMLSAAWPIIKDMKVDSSQTLATGTLEYTPTAGDTTSETNATPEEGFAVAYVTPLSPTDTRKVRLVNVSQRLAGTTWTVILPAETVQAYNGQVLHLGYNARFAQTDLALALNLPMDYAVNYVLYWLIGAGAFSKNKFDTDIYKELLPEWRNNYQMARDANRRGYATRLPVSYDGGAGSLVPEPIDQANSVRI